MISKWARSNPLRDVAIVKEKMFWDFQSYIYPQTVNEMLYLNFFSRWLDKHVADCIINLSSRAHDGSVSISTNVKCDISKLNVKIVTQYMYNSFLKI